MTEAVQPTAGAVLHQAQATAEAVHSQEAAVTAGAAVHLQEAATAEVHQEVTDVNKTDI